MLIKEKKNNHNQNKFYWMNWLEPIRYLNENQSKLFLNALTFENLDLNINKNQLLPILKDKLKSKKENIKTNFISSSDGTIAVASTSLLVDNLIKFLVDISNRNDEKKSNDPSLSIIAIGGYGRGELAPSSDLDILFLLPQKLTQKDLTKLENKIETILYYLWDLGFTVGHSTRNINFVLNDANSDLNLLTSLLDNRFVVGDKELFLLFKSRLKTFLNKSNVLTFVKKKLEESKKRHLKFGSSRYVVEPNVKEGKGGIRDLQTLIWIAKFAYKSDSITNLLKIGALLKSELFAFAEAQRFLLSVRCHLHYRSNREDDILATDSQIDIAEKMQFRKKASQSAVERFMKRYFLATKLVGSLTRIFCSAIEDEFNKPLRFNFFLKPSIELDQPFKIKNDRLFVLKKEYFINKPEIIIKLFHVAHFSNLEIHPETLRFITGCVKEIKKSILYKKSTNRLFLEILTDEKDPSRILRIMNECNVLGRFVPEFQNVVGLIQYDMYHYYTVDEHTIFTITNVHSVKNGTFDKISFLATEAIKHIKFFKALMVAMFLHDIAKGKKGDHSKNGSEIAKYLCPRLGLRKRNTEIVSWLVLNHLLLSNTAFRYDLSDDKIIENCAKLIQTPERLRLLLILTVCDIKAVGPEVWNDWKGALLNELYIKVMRKLNQKSSTNKEKFPVNYLKSKFERYLRDSSWSEKQITSYFEHFNPNYWKMFEFDTLIKHQKILSFMKKNGLKYDTKITIDKNINANELIVIAPDHHGLFSKITGVVASCGIDIVSAKIFTKSDGFAIDTFVVQDKNKKPIVEKRIIENFLKNLKSGLEGTYDFKKELNNRWNEIPSRFRAMKAPARVIIDNETSSNYSIIEVNCKNAPGVLYMITVSMADLGIQIKTASISTYGNRVVDIFYVKDIFGQKITDEKKILKIRNVLLNTLTKTDPSNEKI